LQIRGTEVDLKASFLPIKGLKIKVSLLFLELYKKRWFRRYKIEFCLNLLIHLVRIINDRLKQKQNFFK
jgi:hypothetical protein